jgi:hypothetical protein
VPISGTSISATVVGTSSIEVFALPRRPAYDAYRRLARPCVHPAKLGMEPLDDRGWGWAAREIA